MKKKELAQVQEILEREVPLCYHPSWTKDSIVERANLQQEEFELLRRFTISLLINKEVSRQELETFYGWF